MIRLFHSEFSTDEGEDNKTEPPRGKTNNVVFEQFRHKPGCTNTADG